MKSEIVSQDNTYNAISVNISKLLHN